MEEANKLEEKEKVYSVFEAFALNNEKRNPEDFQNNAIAEEPKEVAQQEEEPKELPTQETEVDFFDVEFKKRTNGKSWEEYHDELLKEKTPKYKSEFTQKLDAYLEGGGDIDTFYKWNSVNVEEMEELELVKLARYIEHPEMDFEDIEWEINKKYDLDEESFNEDEIRESKIKLKQELKKAKELVLKEKEKFLAVKDVIKEEPIIDKEAIEYQKKYEEQYHKRVDEVIKNRTTSLILGDNENEVFNYEPNKDEFAFVESTLRNPNMLFSLYTKPDGDVDLELFKSDITLLQAIRNKDFKEKMLSTLYAVVEERHVKSIKNPTYERKASAPIPKEMTSKEKAQSAFEKFALGK